MNVILSIKPTFANAIIAGMKKVEFRKTLFKKEVEKVFIYSSAPVKKIIGFFTIKEIIKDSPKKLWKQFGEVGYITEADFFSYFRDCKTGYTICIDIINEFPNGIDPYEHIEDFVPPQSFCYYRSNIEPK